LGIGDTDTDPSTLFSGLASCEKDATVLGARLSAVLVPPRNGEFGASCGNTTPASHLD